MNFLPAVPMISIGKIFIVGSDYTRDLLHDLYAKACRKNKTKLWPIIIDSVGFIRSKLVFIIYIPIQLTTIQIDDLDKVRVSCVKILQLNVSLKHLSRFLIHSKNSY